MFWPCFVKATAAAGAALPSPTTVPMRFVLYGLPIVMRWGSLSAKFAKAVGKFPLQFFIFWLPRDRLRARSDNGLSSSSEELDVQSDIPARQIQTEQSPALSPGRAGIELGTSLCGTPADGGHDENPAAILCQTILNIISKFLKSSKNSLSLSLFLLLLMMFSVFALLIFLDFFYPLSRYSTKVNSSRTCSSESTVSLRWLYYTLMFCWKRQRLRSLTFWALRHTAAAWRANKRRQLSTQER